MESKFVWKNGTIVPWENATFPVSCHGLHYGSGVFEGLRSYQTSRGPAVFRLGAHLDRFFASAKVYGMEWPYTREDLARGILELVWMNDFGDCYIRPLAFYGSKTLSLHPNACPVQIVILAWPWTDYLGPKAHEHGVHVTISRWRKFPSEAIPTTAKACGQYLNSILATEEARAGGFDEALLLNVGGTIAEGPGENLFLVRAGELFTNDASSSILPGITRHSVLRLAARLGITTHVGDIGVPDLMSADEAFFTGTAVEITPVTRVDGQAIGSGAVGPVTAKLLRAFARLVRGDDPLAKEWLTLVSWDQPKSSRSQAERGS